MKSNLQQLEEIVRGILPDLQKVPIALPLPVRYDGMMYFFGKGKRGGDEIVADLDMGEEYADGFRIRGWGRIQYLKEENKTPEQLQDECAYYIQDAINAYSEIQLHHILQAIGKTEHRDEVTVSFYKDGMYISYCDGENNYGCYYDPSQPLSNQSAETIDFLLEILSK